MNQSEQELIQQAQAGDTAAFEILVESHAQFVFNLAVRTLNDAHEAEEVAQETFIRAWQGLGNFRAEAQLRTWLYRITTNLCYNRLPRLKADFEALDPAEAPLLLETGRPVEGGLLAAEMRRQIYAAVDDLPEIYRLVIGLRHVDGYSYKEIAQITEMPIGTVKTALFRARQLLRQKLLAKGESTNG